jgi:hypothetical protein
LKTFIIHAGTHKTATSYIQSRLLANRQRLNELGVRTEYPGPPSKKHKPLAASLRRADWGLWERYLERLGKQTNQVLVSAEQFTQPLSQPEHFEPLTKLLSRWGYKLKIVVFLRDQPDYINARYVHSTRRLYHSQPFEDYVQQQLRERAHIFDYGMLFKNLLSDSKLEIKFLPYQANCGDPFERLMNHLGLKHREGWMSADQERGNIQPGCRGVWLAQELNQYLQTKKISRRKLKNAGKVIRHISKREQWDRDRYFGFSPELARRVQNHYAASNQEFAKRVWGEAWAKQFTAQVSERRVYELPSSGPEYEMMERILQEAIATLCGGSDQS